MKWNKLAKKYDNLWVQKYSLTPTRECVIKEISKCSFFNLLDVGCGTGQLIDELSSIYPDLSLTGIDKSSEMIQMSTNKKINAEFINVNVQEYKSEKKYDIITCLHSFPYYENKERIIDKFCDLLCENGILILANASVNNLYDKIIMWFVEKTAEKADYLSKKNTEKLLSNFEIVTQYDIKEKWYMPTISLFVAKKRCL